MVMQTIPKKRCAIYTRKSVEEGLDQEFNSLDAQREAGEAYIASQKANGWVCLPTRYDDGGYSGGNMKRPALQQLLADCEAGLILSSNNIPANKTEQVLSLQRSCSVLFF